MRQQVDARVVKSKNKLKKALLDLMKEKKFEKISVCEICEIAEIHRMTFYNHYADKYELFNETILDIKNKIHNRFSKELISNSSQNSTDQFIHLFEVLINELSEYRPVFKSIIGSEDYYELFNLIHKTFEEGLIDFSYRIFKETSTYLDLKIKFFIGGVGHLITYYMYNKENINYHELKECIRGMIDIFYTKD